MKKLLRWLLIVVLVLLVIGVAAPLFAATVPIYNAAIGLGRGGDDTAAVCTVLEAMAGVERKS